MVPSTIDQNFNDDYKIHWTRGSKLAVDLLISILGAELVLNSSRSSRVQWHAVYLFITQTDCDCMKLYMGELQLTFNVGSAYNAQQVNEQALDGLFAACS